MSEPLLDVHIYAVNFGVNRWPLTSRLPRVRNASDDKDDCAKETVFSSVEFIEPIPESISQLSQSQIRAIESCCQEFELKAYRDLECHSKHVECSGWRGVEHFIWINREERDVLLLDSVEFDRLVEDGRLEAEEAGKNVYGDAIQVHRLYDLDNFPEEITVVRCALLKGGGVLLKSDGIRLRLYAGETLFGRRCAISGKLEIDNVSDNFWIEMPWLEGSIYE